MPLKLILPQWVLAMMVSHELDNNKIFYTNINLAGRIRRDRSLWRIAVMLDFDLAFGNGG